MSTFDFILQEGKSTAAIACRRKKVRTLKGGEVREECDYGARRIYRDNKWFL